MYYITPSLIITISHTRREEGKGVGRGVLIVDNLLKWQKKRKDTISTFENWGHTYNNNNNNKKIDIFFF